jgi:hypothetical protein
MYRRPTTCASILAAVTSSPEGARWAWCAPYAAWAVLIAAVAAGFGWTLGADFLSDDFAYVGRFSALPLTAWPALFVREWSGGIWGVPIPELRPISALSFIVDARLWGINAGGYHLTNLILHTLCAGLVMLIARGATGGRWTIGLAVGVLFALHPVHDEAVIWITGRVDLLSAAGFLLSLHAFLRFRAAPSRLWLATAWCAYAAGIFAKESCLTLPIVAFILDAGGVSGPAARRRDRWAPFVGWAVVLSIYAACRLVATSGVVLPVLPDVEPGELAGFILRRATIYAGGALFPTESAGDAARWALDHPAWIAAGWVAGLTALFAWWRAAPTARRSPSLRIALRIALLYGVAWPAVTTAPLLITYVSLRHLYTASAGIVIGVVVLLAYVLPQRRAFAIGVGILALACAAELRVGATLWRAASDRSRDVSQALGALTDLASPGDVLLLDVPERYGKQLLWAWASPFALRPPFQPHDLSARFIVVEPPEVYFAPRAWPESPALQRLRGHTGGGWVVSARPGRRVTVRRLTPESLRAALRSPLLRLGELESFDSLIALTGEGATP